LKSETFVEAQPKLVPITPAPPMIQELDQFMVEIEDRMDEIYQKILQFAREEHIIPLSKLTSGLRRLEVIRTFILVLFIACRGKIQLWQEEEFGEIYISLL
jgi:segregation and condensation protein A